MRKRHGANSTARPNAVANPLPASTACRSKRHHARDNESGQAQAAALINAAQTPRSNKTPRQSRFYTRLTSLVKHGEFVSDLCYHQATSQEKFHTGNHLRNSHPIQRCWDKGAIPLSHSRGGLDAAPSTTASAPNAHVSDLGHTRLARSNLPVLYTIVTVSAMPFIHERHGKRIQTLLTWVFKLFQGTFQATSNFFERLFGKIAIFPRDFWRHRIYCTTANVFHHRQAAFPLHGLMRFSTGLFSRGQLLNRRPLGRAANSRRLSRRTGKAANRCPR